MNNIEFDLVRLQIHLDFYNVVKPKVSIGKKILSAENQNSLRYWQYELRKRVYSVEKRLMQEENVYFIDYTSLSCVTLKEKKNRFLLTANGEYFISGFVVAFNPLQKRIVLIQTDKPQLTTKDILRLKKYLPQNSILVCDKQHKGLTYCVDKSLSMNIERYFSGIKNKVYAEIRQYQKVVKNYYVTNVSFEYVQELYEQRFKALGYSLVEKCKPYVQTKNEVKKAYEKKK